MLVRVLLLLEPEPLARRIEQLLRTEDVLVQAVSVDQLWQALGSGTHDVVVAAREALPEPVVQSVLDIRAVPDRPVVILLWGREDPAERAALLVAGCSVVLDTGLPDEALRESLAAVIGERSRIRAEQLSAVPRGVDRLSDFVSASPSMQAFLEMARRVVNADSSLLVLGETGVGKEHLARSIHNESQRSEGPFVAVNCGALPEGLLESELFGHERGAFTGATRSRRGYFELGHRGTVFLDEVGEMPLHLQVKLLRVLQDYEVRRVGSERSIGVDVRVIAATNRDLVEESRKGLFRQDLYYRLGVVTLTVPPLRERREDIPALVERYLNQFRTRMVCDVTGVSDEAMAAMLRYTWPGNIRELVNVIERAVLLCRGDSILPEDLPPSLVLEAAESEVVTADGAVAEGVVVPAPWMLQPWSEARRRVLASFEQAYLVHLLQSAQGRIGDAARRAGIQPRSLFDKMRSHGLRKESFKDGHPDA